jgi:hypothetical protein
MAKSTTTKKFVTFSRQWKFYRSKVNFLRSSFSSLPAVPVMLLCSFPDSHLPSPICNLKSSKPWRRSPERHRLAEADLAVIVRNDLSCLIEYAEP